MKRFLVVLLGILLIISLLSIHAAADEQTPEFYFELSIDGQDTKEVHPGDTITVALKLYRTDSNTPFTMYAMQDEIHYDHTFFELINDSAVLGEGITSTDIAMVDEFREFYMNYLSMSGGTQWNPDTLIGTFQLRVIAESGVTTINSRDYLVSHYDGSGSYPCEANQLTVILSTDCTVRFMASGGNEIPNQTVQYGELVVQPEDPIRDGYTFAGWYKDIHLSEKWDFETNTVQGNMTLYAKWMASDTSAADVEVSAGHIWWLWLLLLIVILLVLYTIKRIRDKEKE